MVKITLKEGEKIICDKCEMAIQGPEEIVILEFGEPCGINTAFRSCEKCYTQSPKEHDIEKAGCVRVKTPHGDIGISCNEDCENCIVGKYGWDCEKSKAYSTRENDTEGSQQ